MSFELSNTYIDSINELVSQNADAPLLEELNKLHPADIAEIFGELNLAEANYIYHLLDNDISSDVLIELDEDQREKLLKSLSSKEIAEEIIETLDSDDAADVLNELPEEQQEEIISLMEDKEHQQDIVDLLTYEEGTAGSLMAKELMKVNINWTAAQAVIEMRKQADEIDHIHSIYVVDDSDHLLGRLSLRKLLFSATSSRTVIKDLYEGESIKSVFVDDKREEVVNIMEKYDLVTVPVIDEAGILLGRITIDDALDVMVEEAEKDYQMASGLSEDVESGDSVYTITRARLPWLLIGMIGGLGGATVIGAFDITKNPDMALFIPLIAAMGGNVGVQSAAIIVQGLANKSLRNEKMLSRLSKELMVGLLNGAICSVILMGASMILGYDMRLSITVSLSLLTVIIFAALFGTFIPLTLDKYKIDPAVATGPFITTANDIFGLIIYFLLGNFIYSVL